MQEFTITNQEFIKLMFPSPSYPKQFKFTWKYQKQYFKLTKLSKEVNVHPTSNLPIFEFVQK